MRRKTVEDLIPPEQMEKTQREIIREIIAATGRAIRNQEMQEDMKAGMLQGIAEADKVAERIPGPTERYLLWGKVVEVKRTKE